MAAMPAGTVIGGFVVGRLLRPSDRMRPMGWLAMLSCAPLIFSLAHPPLAVLVLLWALAGAGGAYQLAAAAAFVTALPAGRRVRAFAVAESGLLAAQGLGILTGGAVAERVGAPGAVALAGLMGLLAAAALATDWTRRHTELISMLNIGRVSVLAGTGTGTGTAAAPPTPPNPASATPVPTTPIPATPVPATPTSAAPAPAPLPPDPAPRPAGPPVLNLPVAERGTGRSAPPPGAGRSPGKNVRRSAHRAPRDLSLRARLAATRLLDQVLGDRRGLPFLWDDDPRRQVHQHEDAGRHQGQGDEDQPDNGGVDAGVLTDPGADASHEPTFPCPD
jgi:hypothetical protein